MVKRLMPFLLVLSLSLLFAASAIASFGLSSFSVSAENQDGTPDVQAGSHPYAMTTSFTLNENIYPALLENSPKDIEVELPKGFFGYPRATARCSYAVFVSQAYCPPNTQVGLETTYLSARTYVEDPAVRGNVVYNIEPSAGTAAEFGYYITGHVAPILLDVSVRTGGDYGLTVKVPNITTAQPIEGTTVKLWGVPADPIHDS